MDEEVWVFMRLRRFEGDSDAIVFDIDDVIGAHTSRALDGTLMVQIHFENRENIAMSSAYVDEKLVMKVRLWICAHDWKRHDKIELWQRIRTRLRGYGYL